jgi:cob(I)alamin adenosyltransferase
LDEINLALHCQLLITREVLEFLDKISKETDVVLTGRYAPKELLERADFVDEVKDIKCPKEMVTTKGIQY